MQPTNLAPKLQKLHKFPVDLPESLYFEATGGGITRATLTCDGPNGPIMLGVLNLKPEDKTADLDFFCGEPFHAALVSRAYITLSTESDLPPSLTYKPAEKTIGGDDLARMGGEYCVDVCANSAAGPRNVKMVYTGEFAAFRR